MDYSTSDRILLYLYKRMQNDSQPSVSIDDIRNFLVSSNIFSKWDEKSNNEFINALRYLVDGKYIDQDIEYYKIKAMGIDHAKMLLDPSLNIPLRSIQKQSIANILSAIAIIFAAISIFGGGTVILTNASSRTLTSKMPVSLLDTIDNENHPIITTHLDNWFGDTPEEMTYDGIPYDLNNSSPVIETESETSRNPELVIIPLNINHPIRVHLLINMSYGSPIYTNGQQLEGFDICKVTLYSDDKNATYLLKAGDDVREWVIGGPNVVNKVGNNVQTIWKSTYLNSNMDAVIDHIMITVPENIKRTKLHYITIQDMSQELFQNVNPGIMIYGITIEYQQ